MTVRAIVKPELLRWAREAAGLLQEDAAKKVQVKPERLEGWESGELRPTIKQLRKLAQIYKRPLAVFYLPAPPKRFQAMHDFRRVPGDYPGGESPQLRFEIRQAHYRRDIALQLLELLEVSPARFEIQTDLSANAEQEAVRLREVLGIDLDEQRSWNGPYEALNTWRRALETAGVLVFQMSRVEVAEARGFSIGEHPLPVIVVNSKDSPRGRIFSILHEAAHIMLRSTGLCDLNEPASRRSVDHRIEVFCNHVAGATLVPASALLAENLVRNHDRRGRWEDEEIRTLADCFSVSRETLLRRLVLLDRADPSFYREKRLQYLAEYAQRATGLGGPSVSVKALSQVGKLFARLVLDGYHQEKITSGDVAEYFGVRLKHMPNIEREVLGHPREFGALS